MHRVVLMVLILSAACRADTKAPVEAPAPPVPGLTLRIDPAFDEANLSDEERVWYDRVVMSIKESAETTESYARGNNLYRLSRTVGNYDASLLMALRATGDRRFLDRVVFVSDLFRHTLDDAWADGTRDGFLNWQFLEIEDSPHYGKDTHEMEESLMHGNVALIAYAFHVNRDLDPAYAERADFWRAYLEEHFLKKWSKRAGGMKAAFEDHRGFYKRLAHPRANQLRLAYYLWRMTGDPFYHERAVAIGQELLDHFQPNPDMPHAYQWKHQVAGNDEGWQKVGYAQTVMRVVMEMHLEGFLGFGDPAFMEHLAATFRDAVYGKFPAPYESMALRVSGEGEVSTHIYGLSGFGRWDPSHMLLDVAETRYAPGTYGLWNACYALMAVSRRGEVVPVPVSGG